MSSRAQTLLEIAARETTHPNEALTAARKLRDHIAKHGWAAQSQPQTIRGREVVELRSEIERLQDEITRLKTAVPQSEADRLREVVAASSSKADAVTAMGWALNTYSYHRLDKATAAHGINTSHFLGQAWRRGRSTKTGT